MNTLLWLLALAAILMNTEAKVTDGEKRKIIMLHNFLRGIVYPPATNMKEMSWDEALSRSAQAYSEGCVFEHGTIKQRQHHYFGTIGENLLLSGAYSRNEIFHNVIGDWNNEFSDYNYNGVGNRCAEEKMCGNYTQVVWADSYKVGCGITSCEDGYLVVCHYGPPGNISPAQNVFDLPYLAGTWCSECGNSEDVCVERLCSNEERNAPIPVATTTITPSPTEYLIGETLTLTIDTLAAEGTFNITYDVSGSTSIVGTVAVASNGDVTFTPDGAKPSNVTIDDSINKQLTASITLESSDDQKIFSITHSSGVAGTGASYRVALNCPVVTGNVVVVSSSGTGCSATDYDLSQCSTTFNCDPGYYPASDVTALCTGGAWSIPLPICTEHKSCRAINIEHGQTTCESDANAHGSTCEITCDIGYLLSTNVKSILCNNGTWIGSTAFKCTVPEPTKLSFSPSSYLIGGFVLLEFGITVNVGTFKITYGSIAIGTATVDGTRIAFHVSGSKPGNVAVDTNTASTIFVEISELASYDHGKIISLSYDLNGYYDVIYSIQLSCPPIAKPVYVKSSKPLMHD